MHETCHLTSSWCVSCFSCVCVRCISSWWIPARVTDFNCLLLFSHSLFPTLWTPQPDRYSTASIALWMTGTFKHHPHPTPIPFRSKHFDRLCEYENHSTLSVFIVHVKFPYCSSLTIYYSLGIVFLLFFVNLYSTSVFTFFQNMNYAAYKKLKQHKNCDVLTMKIYISFSFHIWKNTSFC